MSVIQRIREPNPTATRVQDSTKPEVNQKILQTGEQSVAKVSKGIDAIDERIRELEQEWDIERTLQTNFGIVTIASVVLGSLIARPFYALSGIAAGFMIEHALKGWCPPLPILRRLRFRTSSEIDQERYALKAVRGDFEAIGPSQSRQAFEAAGS